MSPVDQAKFIAYATPALEITDKLIKELERTQEFRSYMNSDLRDLKVYLSEIKKLTTPKRGE